MDTGFKNVLLRWRQILRQYMRTTMVSQTSAAFVPVVPLILCAPKYVAGQMTLGQVMQAASAFVTVQIAFNWVVDNYPRLADWTASARRLASLLASLDRLERADREEGAGRIVRQETDHAALRLQLLDPSLVLQRGYAWLTDTEGRAVTRAAQTHAGQLLRATLADGALPVVVQPGCDHAGEGARPGR